MMAPLFDPDTGKLVDRDGLRGVQVRAGGFRQPKTTITADGRKRVEIIRDDNGRTAGFNEHYGDGRIGATATPEPVHITANKE